MIARLCYIGAHKILVNQMATLIKYLFKCIKKKKPNPNQVQTKG